MLHKSGTRKYKPRGRNEGSSVFIFADLNPRYAHKYGAKRPGRNGRVPMVGLRGLGFFCLEYAIIGRLEG